MHTDGRSAIITGASSGIGLAVARVLHEEGFALTMTGRDPDKLQSAATSVAAANPTSVQMVHGSVADEAFLDDLVATHLTRYGSADVLVNNAGVSGNRQVGQIDAEFLDDQLAVNIRAVILLTSKCLPMLNEAVRLRGTAQVINTSSNAGKRGEATLSSYSATKAAVLGFTQALHDELAGAGIKATAICPGLVDTAMAAPYRDGVAAWEMISPNDIAEAVRMTTRLSKSCVIPEMVLLRPTEWKSNL